MGLDVNLGLFAKEEIREVIREDRNNTVTITTVEGVEVQMVARTVDYHDGMDLVDEVVSMRKNYLARDALQHLTGHKTQCDFVIIEPVVYDSLVAWAKGSPTELPAILGKVGLVDITDVKELREAVLELDSYFDPDTDYPVFSYCS